MTCPHKNFEFQFFPLHISLHQLGVEHTEILNRLCVWTLVKRENTNVYDFRFPSTITCKCELSCYGHA